MNISKTNIQSEIQTKQEERGKHTADTRRTGKNGSDRVWPMHGMYEAKSKHLEGKTTRRLERKH